MQSISSKRELRDMGAPYKSLVYGIEVNKVQESWKKHYESCNLKPQI